MRISVITALCLVLLACATPAARVQPPGTLQVVMADGHGLALWEKRPSVARGTVLLIHGRTWSALPNFDLQVEGEDVSVMDAFVRAGYAAYALDLRGYGSTPRDASGWLTPDRAVEDVRTALDWIRTKHGATAALIGYSRGSQVAMLAAQRHPTAMSSLVLYGFPAGPRAPPAPAPEVPPRQPNTERAATSDFITPGSVSQKVIDAYVAQAVKSNPVRVDWRDEVQFVFEPAQVRAPTLFLYGARDPLLVPDAVLKLFARLGTTDRTWVTLPDSDHAAHVERAHDAWIHAITSFIERPR